MDTLIFDADKSAVIDLATLDRTIKLESYKGRTQLHPFTHADLIKKLVETTHRFTNFKPEVAPIVIKHDRCRRREWTGPDNECPVENYVIDRLITKIDFHETESYKDDASMHGEMSIALSYNEKGIQVGFGHKVRICQNMNIFSDRLFTTYNDRALKGIKFDQGMHLLEAWLQKFDSHMKETHIRIEELKTRRIDEKDRLQMFGKLYELASMANAGMEVNAPLNVTECNRMVAASVKEQQNRGLDAPDETAWDFTNWCTSVLNPRTSDMVSVLNRNNVLNNFLVDQFSNN